MLKYGIFAKSVELLCFKHVLESLSEQCPDIDIDEYKKECKRRIRGNVT